MDNRRRNRGNQFHLRSHTVVVLWCWLLGFLLVLLLAISQSAHAALPDFPKFTVALSSGTAVPGTTFQVRCVEGTDLNTLYSKFRNIGTPFPQTGNSTTHEVPFADLGVGDWVCYVDAIVGVNSYIATNRVTFKLSAPAPIPPTFSLTVS